jgi:hypothetical protein
MVQICLPLADAQLRDGKYVQAFTTITLTYDPHDEVQAVRATPITVAPVGGDVAPTQ